MSTALDGAGVLTPIPPPNPHPRGDGTQARKPISQHRKVFRPDAHGRKHGDGFGGFGQATQEVKAFARQGGVRQAAFFGHCGKR